MINPHSFCKCIYLLSFSYNYYMRHDFHSPSFRFAFLFASHLLVTACRYVRVNFRSVFVHIRVCVCVLMSHAPSFHCHIITAVEYVFINVLKIVIIHSDLNKYPSKCSLLYEKICRFAQKLNKDTSMQSKRIHSRHVHLEKFQIAVHFIV